MFQSLDDQVVPNVVEERADIHFQYPVLTTAPNGTLTQSIVGRSSGPVPIRIRMENRIDHSLHITFHRPLSHPIGDRRDAKDALLAVVLWNADSAAVAEVGTGRKEIYERTHLSGEVFTTRINCVQRRCEHDLLG